MTNFTINLLAFILAISFLVAFHEWGHYCVARLLQVKVLRFSIGFGPIIWSRLSRSGVEFCLSAIPLGGYVKMLDEREGPVQPDELHLAFNRQNVWKRIAIVIAGPAANFILAILLFIVVYLAGVGGIAPLVKNVIPDSPAAQAQINPLDEIIAVENNPTQTLMQVSRALAEHMDQPVVSLTLLHQDRPYTVSLPMPPLTTRDISPLENMGLTMGLPARIGQVDPNTAADKAGLIPGDVILGVDDVINPDWMDLVNYLSTRADQTLTLTIKRNDELLTLPVIPQKHESGRGLLGVHLDSSLLRTEQYPFLLATQKAFTQTLNYSWLTLKMIGKMITGQASLEHLSGPVSIAQVAGATAKVGVTYYLDFLAIISISLGVLNLLPVPVLDGGHLLYYCIEVVRRRPLTEAVQNMGLRLGLAILVSLMVVAFYNDILRLV